MLHRKVVIAAVLVIFLLKLLGNFRILFLSNEQKGCKCCQVDVIWGDHFQVPSLIELVKATHGREHNPLVKILRIHEHALDDIHSCLDLGGRHVVKFVQIGLFQFLQPLQNQVFILLDSTGVFIF